MINSHKLAKYNHILLNSEEFNKTYHDKILQ